MYQKNSISNGKIATHIQDHSNNDSEWEIKHNKDGITIEDALPSLPIIELSIIKKDKRVFGDMGNSQRNNSRAASMCMCVNE
jgi:hypothetical protein